MKRWGGAALCGAALLIPRTVIATPSPQRPDSLTFTLVAPDSARAGHPIPIVLRLTNTGDRPLDLYLTGRTITFDIVVTRVDGEIVWRRLAHVTSQQILQVKTLAPGEMLEVKDRWTATAPGDYTLMGVIPTDREPLRTAPARLRVAP